MHWPSLIYHPCYSELHLPERHRYPIGKYRALYQALLAAGVPQDCFIEPTSATRTELALVHHTTYIEALCSGQLDAKSMRRIGFPWSEFLIRRSMLSVGGTILTAKLALQKNKTPNAKEKRTTTRQTTTNYSPDLKLNSASDCPRESRQIFSKAGTIGRMSVPGDKNPKATKSPAMPE